MRLIDAEALKKQAYPFPCAIGVEYAVTLRAIDDAPTIDAAPMVHGYWFFTEYDYYDCSVCGEAYYNGCDSTAEANHRLTNGDAYSYCPYCGAKMNGGHP